MADKKNKLQEDFASVTARFLRFALQRLQVVIALSGFVVIALSGFVVIALRKSVKDTYLGVSSKKDSERACLEKMILFYLQLLILILQVYFILYFQY